MHRVTNNTNMTTSTPKRGDNRRGFRWDKSSKEYADYRRKYAESMSKKARRALEELARKPVQDSIYKHSTE